MFDFLETLTVECHYLDKPNYEFDIINTRILNFVLGIFGQRTNFYRDGHKLLEGLHDYLITPYIEL